MRAPQLADFCSALWPVFTPPLTAAGIHFPLRLLGSFDRADLYAAIKQAIQLGTIGFDVSKIGFYAGFSDERRHWPWRRINTCLPGRFLIKILKQCAQGR